MSRIRLNNNIFCYFLTFISVMFFSVVFLFSVFADKASASVTLNWYVPTTNTDGSRLTNLAGFKLYYGYGSPCNFMEVIDVGYVSNYSVTLPIGTYCFALSSYNSVGIESSLSNTVYRTETDTYIDNNYFCPNPDFESSGSMYYYPSIQSAYDSLYSGSRLRIHAGDYDEDIVLQQSKNVSFRGGYVCDFSSNPGYTVIHGYLQISYGSLIADRLIIK